MWSTPEQAAPLRDDAERHAVRLLTGVRAVAGAVQMQDHAVGPAPLRHRGHRRVADREVLHDDDRADLLGELGALVHLLHGGGGDVEVMALDLTRRGLGALHGLHAVDVAVAPAHERLRVDVLVVLGEVQTTAQRLVDDTAVVLRRQAELRLRRRADQRATELVEVLALHRDAVRGAGEGLDVRHRNAHVLEAQRLERLEAEDVADDRGREVGDRALFEEVDVVGDERDVLARGARDLLDAVGLGLVVLVGRQAIGPDDGPRRGRRLARDSGGCLDRVDALLRRDPEGAKDVGVLGLVVRIPVAHLGIRRDAGVPAALRLLLGGAHSILSRCALLATLPT